MTVYLIAYQLRHPESSEEELRGGIKALGGHWWHYFPQTWLVYGEGLTANSIFERLKSLLHLESEDNGKLDRILIIEIGTDKQGWLVKKAWDWINEANSKLV